MSTYLTVAIPYVNAEPHLGYAFELVEADVAARAKRALGEPVRFVGGTDDHSLKNVLAAEAAGEDTATFVARCADRFTDLAGPLALSFDDTVHTARDPRHRPSVERLWRACHAAGDLEPRPYRGRYCVGCEQFVGDDDLIDGRCREHRVPVEEVEETNWFFRLSRYQDRLAALIERDELVVEPAPFRAGVLAFVRAGLTDISVSRSVGRARGWGIPVPDDATQVVAVWFDALTNYLSALGFGDDDPAVERWWTRSDRRIHVVGKGIVRFHAVVWPAFLLSAGLTLPTRIHVHPYLTVDGDKLSKSGPSAATAPLAPVAAVGAVGTDRLRWWFTVDPSTTADTDVGLDRIVATADADLANGLANAAARVLGIARRAERPRVPAGSPLPDAVGLARRVHEHLAEFRRREAIRLVRDALAALDRDIERTTPWRLTDHTDPARLDEVLGRHAATVRAVADAVTPIVPSIADRVLGLLDGPVDAASGPVVDRVSAPPVRASAATPG